MGTRAIFRFRDYNNTSRSLVYKNYDCFPVNAEKWLEDAMDLRYSPTSSGHVSKSAYVSHGEMAAIFISSLLYLAHDIEIDYKVCDHCDYYYDIVVDDNPYAIVCYTYNSYSAFKRGKWASKQIIDRRDKVREIRKQEGSK